MHSEDIAAQRLGRALRDRLRPALTRVVAPVDITAWDVGGEPVPFAVAAAAEFRPFRAGQAWGRPWDTTWFRIRGTVPPEVRGERVELVVDLGRQDDSMPGFQAEALVYRADGTVVKGLQPRNNWVPVDGDLDVFLEAAANPQFFGRAIDEFRPTPLGDLATAGAEPQYVLGGAALVVRDAGLAGLLADLELVAGLMSAADPTLRARATRAVERAVDVLDAYGPEVDAVREPLTTVLGLSAAGSAHRVSAVGHAHIDSAWLWPLRETRRKVARTVANVLDLMDTDDRLVYAMSAAQHWEWLREDHPALFERARARVAGGRFVPVGGMWVESDTVLPGGEAMARQFAEGQRYFLEHFGRTSRVAWLPDSFGYSGALPQIVRLAGIEFFLTQKISWNRVNRFPHHTLDWVGIDGTPVFTHFPPADTYNGELTVAELTHTAQNFHEKAVATRSLIPFGHGDGGGGPTREMLDRADRAADQEGIARVRVESPEAFFDAARAELPDPPQWYGELYLELHRGTLTSQAAMKRGNRRGEHLLRSAELWAATAAVAGVAPYPYDELRDAWRTVLLHQFHDILPGSSIGWVHREARATYAALEQRLDTVIAAAQRALAGDGELPVTFNAGPLPVDGVPPGGAQALAEPGSRPPSADATTLRSDHTVVTLEADGTVSSIVDVLTGIEAVAPGGRAGLLQLHPDHPARWDAWDIDRHYRATVTDVTDVTSMTTSADETRAWAVIERTFGASTVRQTVVVHRDRPGAEFRVEVDWHEQQRLLKLAFDLDVHADRARFETQFGHVTRAIHENTSWDAARFEVAAHRWVHVGEPVGAALANDATYGHEVRRVARRGGGMAVALRATLVRGPQFPDPQTDQGRHDFRFHLVPAATPAAAVAAGYALNLPPVARTGARDVQPLVRLDGPALIESVKLAEDRSGDVVVRIYEPYGVPGHAVLHTSFPDGPIVLADLLERPLDPTGPRITLRPFQIVTLRVGRS